ncbi:MAG: hypothetical protein QUS35_03355, partial [bacterium]|nr:hypothetical protein [bacterium]
ASDVYKRQAKTSTGYGFVRGPDGRFSAKGATDDDIRLMRAHCGPDVRIKAAGGIRSLDDLLRVKALGADRVGATATAAIVAEAARRQDGGGTLTAANQETGR